MDRVDAWVTCPERSPRRCGPVRVEVVCSPASSTRATRSSTDRRGINGPAAGRDGATINRPSSVRRSRQVLPIPGHRSFYTTQHGTGRPHCPWFSANGALSEAALGTVPTAESDVQSLLRRRQSQCDRRRGRPSDVVSSAASFATPSFDALPPQHRIGLLVRRPAGLPTLIGSLLRHNGHGHPSLSGVQGGRVRWKSRLPSGPPGDRTRNPRIKSRPGTGDDPCRPVPVGADSRSRTTLAVPVRAGY